MSHAASDADGDAWQAQRQQVSSATIQGRGGVIREVCVLVSLLDLSFFPFRCEAD